MARSNSKKAPQQSASNEVSDGLRDTLFDLGAAVDGDNSAASLERYTGPVFNQLINARASHNANAALPAAQTPEAGPAKAPRQRTPASPHAGHRERLRARLSAAGPDALADYELLEMILFGVNRRGDTKPLAKRLIAAFGSFAGVINAPEARLREVSGVGDRVVSEFLMIRAASLRLAREEIIDQPVLSSWSAVVDYCRTAMAHADREQFRILFLDKRNRLIAEELQQEGTVDHTPVYVREVVKRALELSATALVLVHNHPSGDPTPSHADVDMTNRIVQVAKPLGILVHDHLIIGCDGHQSFRSLGLLR